MSYGIPPGTIQVLCSKTCMADTHVIIERDYENVPTPWGFVVASHEALMNGITESLQRYIDKVDEETTWVIQSVKRLSIRQINEEIQREIQEILEDIDAGEEAPIKNQTP